MVLHFFHKTNITINWHRFTINSWSLMHTCSEYSQTCWNVSKGFSVDAWTVPWTFEPQTLGEFGCTLRLSVIITSGCDYFTHGFTHIVPIVEKYHFGRTWDARDLTCLADASPHHIKSDIIASMHRHRSRQDWWTSKDVVLLHWKSEVLYWRFQTGSPIVIHRAVHKSNIRNYMVWYVICNI